MSTSVNDQNVSPHYADWQAAIDAAEAKIKRAEKTITGLRSAIGTFRRNLEAGTAFPGSAKGRKGA